MRRAPPTRFPHAATVAALAVVGLTAAAAAARPPLASRAGPRANSYAGYREAGPWPMPKSLTRRGNVTARFAPAGEFRFVCSSAAGCAAGACTAPPATVLTAAFERYAAILAPANSTDANAAAAAASERASSSPGAPDAVIRSVAVCVASADEKLTPDVDESYEITVEGGGDGGTSTLRAATVYGALRGLQTMSEMTTPFDAGAVVNTPVDVSDGPAYSYRGLMIDPSITFLPVAFLEHIVDGMAMNHLNALHVHWTDIASFPIASEKFPELARGGAYDPRAVYTLDDMRRFVEYARLRGVRIIAEFDMPGHGGWAYGRPDLCLSSCSSVLDVTDDKVYTFLGEFLEEMRTVFVDPVLMLGGDEVGLDARDPTTGAPLLLKCFDLDPKASAWMKKNGWNSSNITTYFWTRLVDDVLADTPSPMVWFGVPKTGDPPIQLLPKRVVANVWGDAEWANYSVAHGHPTVLSVSPWWYLPPYNNAASGGGVWPGSYLHDPCDELACNDTNRHLVLGGGVAQWGASAGNFDSATWQGAAAAAERLWVGSIRDADPPVVSPGGAIRRDIVDRLAVHFCRMSLRGVQAGFYYGTGSLSGTTHWPVGKEGDEDFVPRAACPSEWLLKPH